MRIGIYSPGFRGVTGETGVGTYTAHLGYGLSEMGHDVHVLTCGSPARIFRDGPLSVNVTSSNYFPVVERFLPGSGSCYHISKAMRRMVERERLDVVEMANWEGMGLLFGWRRSIPMVIRLHTSSRKAHSINGTPIEGEVKWDAKRERWQALMADALVTHSEAHRREMAEELGISKDRIAVIPHGIPVDPQFKRSEARTSELNVVFLGRLETRKGSVDLLNAIPKILAAVPEARFTLIGRDRDHCPGNRTHAQYLRDEFPAEVQARIKLLGHIPDNEVTQWLQTADVFVAPSLYESFGLVFLEAMRWGTPVVGTWAGVSRKSSMMERPAYWSNPNRPANWLMRLSSYLKIPPGAVCSARWAGGEWKQTSR